MEKRKNIINTVAGIVIGSFGGYILATRLKKKDKKAEKEIDNRANKFKNYFDVFDTWMTVKETGKSLGDYFKEEGYDKIAIYGMGKLGKHFVNELAESGIKVLYAIDRKENILSEIKVYSMDDEWPEADVIVVTATFDYENIYNSITQKSKIKVISLEDVLYELKA